jgi:phosphoglycolate phosphatase
MQRLILFDIDGTLLSADGAAGRVFRRSLEEVYGTAGPSDGVSFAGKTDPQIAHELLGAAGIPPALIEANLPLLWKTYLRELPAELESTRVDVFPGVFPLLDRVEAFGNGSALGLLTGNIREGARLKLSMAGIGFRRFSVGAFGSDHADRRQLPAIAVERALDRFGRRFEGKDIVIIGDTPADIACGESLGVRTIAVATGSYSLEELAGCGPDHLLASLAGADRVLRAIFDPHAT